MKQSQVTTDDLRARLERGGAPGWRPAVGDVVVGTVVEIDEAVSNYGEGTYPIITVCGEDKSEVAIHGFHSVLKSEIARKKPAVGDLLGVKYLGVPEGKKYEAYRVRVERAETPVDWDTMAAQAEGELTDAPAFDDEEPF
ncbi:MAG: hypothetical protein ABSB99_04290 [Acidimicrobiales bacterium]